MRRTELPLIIISLQAAPHMPHSVASSASSGGGCGFTIDIPPSMAGKEPSRWKAYLEGTLGSVAHRQEGLEANARRPHVSYRSNCSDTQLVNRTIDTTFSIGSKDHCRVEEIPASELASIAHSAQSLLVVGQRRGSQGGQPYGCLETPCTAFLSGPDPLDPNQTIVSQIAPEGLIVKRIDGTDICELSTLHEPYLMNDGSGDFSTELKGLGDAIYTAPLCWTRSSGGADTSEGGHSAYFLGGWRLYPVSR